MLDRLPTNRTNLQLLRALNARTDVPTIIEQGIHTLRITDLTHLALFVGHLPVRRAFAPPLALLIAADVLVAGALFDEDALAVLLVVAPATSVGVAVRVGTSALGMFFAGRSTAGEEWSGVGMARRCDVGAGAGIKALEEVAGVVTEPKEGDCDLAGVSLDRVLACGEP